MVMGHMGADENLRKKKFEKKKLEMMAMK